MEPFFKFPKTPHIAGSSVVDDDEVLSDLEVTNLLTKTTGIASVVIQEKVDGANVSVHFEQEWQPILQKRSGVIGQGEKAQYNVFREWAYNHMEALWAVLGSKYCLFGEWLWCQHCVSYDKLPDFFIAFDILNKETNEYLSHTEFMEMIGDRFQVVPLIKKWNLEEAKKIKFSVEILKLVNGKSQYSKSESQEGCYIRFESEEKVLFRAKLRRKNFVCGRLDFDTRIVNNKLEDGK